MSAKTKKPAASKKAKKAPSGSAEAAVLKIAPPSGRAPRAVVSARHGLGMVERAGKGFSSGELSKVGLSTALALRWKVPVDFRRRSSLDPNVAALKKWYTHPKKAEAAPQPKPAQAAPAKRTAKKKES